jgi:hypothetical protein
LIVAVPSLTLTVPLTDVSVLNLTAISFPYR